mmetsp:Transcript_114578/g.296922  ORF Transcript_114578/g.296922 Transcript_114578/m.296922 type:complete len:236 (-) Transcript_114578:94-801(-)
MCMRKCESRGMRRVLMKLILSFSASTAILAAPSTESCPAGYCDCWMHVGQFAPTTNGHSCTLQPKGSEWTGGNSIGYPKMIFCYDMPSQNCDLMPSSSGIQYECYEQFYARDDDMPCKDLPASQASDRCWIPYIKTANDSCAPMGCTSFGKWTEPGRLENGSWVRPAWSLCDASEDAPGPFVGETCPPFDKADSDSTYPDPACPGSQYNAVMSAASLLTAKTLSAALFIGILILQ